MIIYMVTNKLNEKKYIGQTRQSLKSRWYQHCHDNGKRTSPLKNAILKYGKENFKIELIDDHAETQEELDELEIHYITIYNTLTPSGYNYRQGGDSGGALSEETKIKIGEYHKGKTISIKQRKDQSQRMNGKGNPMYGKKHSLESLLKMRNKKLGKVQVESTRIKRGNSLAKFHESLTKEDRKKLYGMQGENHPLFVHVSEEIKSEIIKLHNDGISKRQLRFKFNLSKKVIDRIINQI